MYLGEAFNSFGENSNPTGNPTGYMAGYARINLLQGENDYFKNRLAKIGQANDSELNTVKPRVKKQLQLRKQSY